MRPARSSVTGTAVKPVGVDQRLADRLVSVEPGERASQVWRWRIWVQIVRIDFHFGPELGGTGYLDHDRVLGHNGTVARAVGEVEQATGNGVAGNGVALRFGTRRFLFDTDNPPVANLSHAEAL